MSKVTRPITIVIPAYNYGEYVSFAVKSAQTQLDPAEEIIVVDDCSTDETMEVLSGIDGITVLSTEENGGVSKCMNLALEQVKTDWFVQLDADDILFPMFNRHMARAAEKYSDTSMIYSDVAMMTYINGSISRVEHQIPLYNWDKMQTMNYIPATVLLNTRIVREVGGWTEGLSHHEDYDLFLRLGEMAYEKGECISPIKVGGVLWGYVVHADSKSKLCGQDEMIAHRDFVVANWRSRYEGVDKW